ncbi:MAG: S-layer homology domain-containing protein [Actinomycetota bacterium]
MTVRASWLSVLVAVAAVGVLAGPATASDLFEDVPSGDTFHDDITWLAESGITRGCNPPDNTRFCPDEAVTRGQMAAFLTRALDLPAAAGDFSDT